MARDDEEAAERPSGGAGLFHDLRGLGRGGRRMFSAHLGLLRAELGLARSAVSWLLVAALVTLVVGVGLGLSVLALIGVALASWWGSWTWALVALVALQAVLLALAIGAVRRLLRCLTLPHSRRHFAAFLGTGRRAADAGDGADAEEAREP